MIFASLTRFSYIIFYIFTRFSYILLAKNTRFSQKTPNESILSHVQVLNLSAFLNRG